MSTTTKHYRQTRYGDYYTIEYRPQSDGTIKLFCTEHPRNPHGSAVTECHLYPSNEICVAAGHAPRTLDRAKAISTFWMEGYSKYIRTGTFPNDGAKVHV